MKKSILIVMTLLAFMSCKTEQKEDVKAVQEEAKEIAAVTPEMMETAVIYEANIRQYSPEGTFAEFTKDIPQLKQLGVKIIWLMPIFPISETKRKAQGDVFVSDIKDPEERKKYLGSYYAVSDFTKVNPEFGNKEDFRTLLKTAHDNGIYVILDWVPNHTGWDHPWLKTNPEFYTKNDKGEITDPLNDDGSSKGWGDVAQLDYSNTQMQEKMIKDMEFWVTQENIDGFRCDHVGPVPISFWAKAIPQLKAKRTLFMLAENDDPKFMKGSDLFDMEYGWKQHHLMNEIKQGNKTLEDFDKMEEYISTAYENDDILMNFVTNHDENSWAGTVQERLGDASEVMTVFSYIVPGMPLIYSGQEYDLNHRLKFFEKDSITKTKGKTWDLLEKLGKLKNTNPALNGGKNKGTIIRPATNNDAVLVLKRSKNGNTITFIANFSNEEQRFNNIVQGKYLDYMLNKNVEYKNGIMILKPWEYKVLID